MSPKPAASPRDEDHTGPAGSSGPSGPIAQLIRDGGLSAVFQPIVDLGTGEIFAHEALIRGPAALPLHSPDRLFVQARRENLLVEFEVACILVQLARWSELRQAGRLFLNVSALALVQAVRQRSIAGIVRKLESLGIATRSIVFEITEHEHVTDTAALLEVVRGLHAAGFSFALDDFGDGRSSLRLWSELAPDFVKIDKYFMSNISDNAQKLQTMRALTNLAEIFGSRLIAEGIESTEDLRTIRNIGVAFGQGYALARPAPMPWADIEAPARDALQVRQVSVMPAARSAASPARVQEFTVYAVPPISPETTNERVADLFAANPDWPALAVVDGERPIALVDRRRFMDDFAKRYFREIFGRRPCLQFANCSPRLIERSKSAAELVSVLTSDDQRYLTEGFIFTDDGRYVGLGSSDQLVRNVTESRIDAARYANPLTLLPGNVPTNEHLARLLAAGTDFVACSLDLSNFKSFNDYYGYWLGDEVIKLVAGLASRGCDSRVDFVGHIGGDDFMILFQSADWEARCRAIIDDFDRAVVDLYDKEARLAGGIRSDDRHGVTRFFGYVTLYAGATPVRPGRFKSIDQVISAAAQEKALAKTANASLRIGDGGTTTSMPAAAGAAPRAPAGFASAQTG